MRGDCSTCSYYGNCPGLSALCVGWTPSWVADGSDEYDEEVCEDCSYQSGDDSVVADEAIADHNRVAKKCMEVKE